jgi:hypothetical protein
MLGLFEPLEGGRPIDWAASIFCRWVQRAKRPGEPKVRWGRRHLRYDPETAKRSFATPPIFPALVTISLRGRHAPVTIGPYLLGSQQWQPTSVGAHR